MNVAGFPFAAVGTAHGHPIWRPEGLWQRIDADRSGSLSAGEAAGAPEPSRLATAFDRIDANGDGQVTRRELSQDIRTYGRDGMPRRPATGQVRETPPQVAPQSLYEALVSAIDTDGDQRLSRDEVAATPMTGFLSKRFDVIDTDGDSLPTSREVDAFEDTRAARRMPEVGAGESGEGIEGFATGATGEADEPTQTGPALAEGRADGASSEIAVEAGIADPVADGSQTSTPPAHRAVSLCELLFSALEVRPEIPQGTAGGDAARQFLHLLAEAA